MEKVKVRKNAKECFAEMGKNGKMQNRLRSQMVQLDSPKLQKSIEKFRYGKCKTTFHKITEYNGLKGTFHGVIFTFFCTPLDHTLRLATLDSCTATSDILLLRQPVDILATASSSTLDLSFLGAISKS